MTNPTHDEDVRLVRRSVIRDNEERASEALDRILSRYDALVAEHEAVRREFGIAGHLDMAYKLSREQVERIVAAHDKVEGMMR